MLMSEAVTSSTHAKSTEWMRDEVKAAFFCKTNQLSDSGRFDGANTATVGGEKGLVPCEKVNSGVYLANTHINASTVNNGAAL